MQKKQILLTIYLAALLSCSIGKSQTLNDTFDPVTAETVPKNFDELWADYDPAAEPLDIEVLHEWEEDGVVMRVVRYRIGVFKGEKAMMAAVYGYPKNGNNLPGLVQIHGGGQYADYRAVLTNAKRGYATISIAWAGRINAPNYKVTSDVVKLFWKGDTNSPDYKITTDWGALDGYHAPTKYEGHHTASVQPASYTLDEVESPRNVSWFLWSVGARRALTFLENQDVVNPNMLGMYGHSMGGKITVLSAFDSRVKAAAPSCGGISDIDNGDALYDSTISDDIYLNEISCPVIFLSPANDFHGHLGDLPNSVDLLQTDLWRVVSAAHHNHQDLPASEVTGLLWMDQYLKDTFTYPQTAQSSLALNTASGTPKLTVTPDESKTILSVDVYYTQQAEDIGDVSERIHRINRFWHYAKPARSGNQYVADMPLVNTDQPLWCYANIVYSLDEPVSGAGYYYGIYSADSFNLSTLIHVASVSELQAAGVVASKSPSHIIETFEENWEKEWFTYKTGGWDKKTHKVYNDIWKALPGAELSLEVKSEKSNVLEVEIDDYSKRVQINAGNSWQTVTLSQRDFHEVSGATLPTWDGILTLSLSGSAKWQGSAPAFRNLRWVNTNLALEGTASQSSTDLGGDASRAIDGNSCGLYDSLSVTHTASETNSNPWWQVDLGGEYRIAEIKIFNRTDDCCMDQLSNFTVYVIDSSGSTTFSQSFTSYPDPSVTVKAHGTAGGIVKIQLDGGSILSLAEVEVYESLHLLSLKAVDGSTGVNIQNALVTINNKEYVTDNLGQVPITLANGTYDLMLSKNGYQNVSQSLNISSDKTATVKMSLKPPEPEKLLLQFVVNEANSPGYVSGALIELDTLSYLTNYLGQQYFSLDSGSYSYTITLPGYFPVDGSIHINSDTSLYISMRSTTAEVKFRVKEGVSPLADADVSLDGDTVQTNYVGLAVFSELAVDENYSFAIDKSGYRNVSFNFKLEKDTVIDVQLEAFTGLNNGTNSSLRCYPSPAQDFLMIDSDWELKEIKIFNLDGQMIYSKSVSGKKYKLELPSNIPDFSLIKVTCGNGMVYTKKILHSEQ